MDFLGHQCNRKSIREGFCAQHHPDAAKEREAKQNAKWEREIAIARAHDAVRACGDKVRDAAVAYYTHATTVDSVIENAVRDYTEAVNRLKALENEHE